MLNRELFDWAIDRAVERFNPEDLYMSRDGVTLIARRGNPDAWEVVCFEEGIGWTVQHPDKPPETWIDGDFYDPYVVKKICHGVNCVRGIPLQIGENEEHVRSVIEPILEEWRLHKNG